MPELIHGKSYNTVAERIQAAHTDPSWKLLEIRTEVIDVSEKLLTVKATVVFTTDGNLLHSFTGMSSVSKDTTNAIERQNPVEIAETSAVGRALAFAGYSTTDSVASVDEVEKSKPVASSSVDSTFVTDKQLNFINTLLSNLGEDRDKWHQKYNIDSFKNLTKTQAMKLINELQSMSES